MTTPQRLALLLAILLGAGCRIWFALSSGLSLDEVQVLSVSGLPTVPDVLAFLRDHESHPPAFYLLVRLWIGLFPTSDSGLVLLPLLLGSALIPVVCFLVSGVLSSPRAGVIAAWLVALSPTLVRYSAMLRPYALLALLCTLLLVAALAVMRGAGWRAVAAYVLCGTLMVYSHNWSWVVLVSLNATLLLGLLQRTQRLVTIRRLFVGNALIGLLFLPWIGAMLHQARVAGHVWPTKDLWLSLKGVLWVLTGIGTLELVLIVLAVTVLGILRWRSGGHLTIEQRTLAFCCFGTVCGSILLATAASPIQKLLVSQCFAMLTPVVLLGFVSLFRWDRQRFRWLSVIVLVLSLAVEGAWVATAAGFVRSDGREVGAILSEVTRRDDLVIVLPDYAAPALGRYLHTDATMIVYPHEGFPNILEFDSRLAKDADTSALPRLMTSIREAAIRGGRTWWVRWENMPPTSAYIDRAIDQALTTSYGDPVCVVTGPSKLALFEDLTARLYEVRHDSLNTVRTEDYHARARACRSR